MLIDPDYSPFDMDEKAEPGEISEVLEGLFSENPSLHSTMAAIFEGFPGDVYSIVSDYLLHQKDPVLDLQLARTLLATSCFTLEKDPEHNGNDSVPGIPNKRYMRAAHRILSQLRSERLESPEISYILDNMKKVSYALQEVSGYFLDSKTSLLIIGMNIEGRLMMEDESIPIVSDTRTYCQGGWEKLKHYFISEYEIMFDTKPTMKAWDFVRLACESESMHQYLLVSEIQREAIENPRRILKPTEDLVKMAAVSSLHMMSDVANRTLAAETMDFTAGYHASFARNVRILSRGGTFGVNLMRNDNLNDFEEICFGVINNYLDMLITGFRKDTHME
ncbi:MAG: hypothetical protein HGA85_03885 [Nanoarchaeota archaeon]|nr:hypothetical protein [Nanoarchaeota archaeon]